MIGIVIRVFAVIMLVTALFLLAVTIFFSFGSQAPSIFGHNIYIVKTDAFELLQNGTAVITEQSVPDEIQPGNIVIYSDDEGKPRLGEILSAELFETVFGFTARNDVGTELELSQGQIIGKAVYYDNVLGGFLTFATSPFGVLVIAVLPCCAVLLIEVGKALRKRIPSKKKVTPVKKQDEVPTYIPKPKQSAQPVQSAARKPVNTPATPKAASSAAAINAYKNAADIRHEDIDSPLLFDINSVKAPKQAIKDAEATVRKDRIARTIEETVAVSARKDKPQIEPVKKNVQPSAIPSNITAKAEAAQRAAAATRSAAEAKAAKAESAVKAVLPRGGRNEPEDVMYMPKNAAAARSTTTTFPRMDELFDDEGGRDDKRYDIDDILSSIEKKKKNTI